MSLCWKWNWTSAKRRQCPGAKFLACASLLVYNVASAEFSLPEFGLSLPDSLQIHGFASQGYIWTSDNNFFGDSDRGGTFDFRDLGINVSWRIIPRLQLSLQGVAHWAGDTDDGDPRLDYGLLDYTFLSDSDNLLGLRLGRVINPFGLYNDTRDVAFTRPSILLPESIYFDTARALFLSADGGQIYGERRTRFGDFLLQLNLIYPRVGDPETEQSLFLGDPPGEIDSDLSFIGRLIYELDGGRVRLGVTGLQFNVPYDRGGPNDPLLGGDFTFEELLFSAQYNGERWSLTGEYARRFFDFTGFGPALPDADFVSESYYVQGTYRFKPDWEAVLRYDVLFGDVDDRDGRNFTAQTGLPRHLRFAKDFTVGLRWDITPKIMLRAEYHRVDGAGWLAIADNPNLGQVERNWDLVSMLISYRF